MSPATTPSRRLFGSLLLLAASACGGADDRDSTGERESTGDRPNAEAADAITITTANGEVDLALVNDTIAFRLSEEVLAKVREKTDTGTVKGSGLGGFIERTVKSTVQQALSSAIRIPVSDVEDARYEDGRIVLMMRDRRAFSADGLKVNGRPVMESFPPDDARRFVDAVRTKIAAR